MKKANEVSKQMLYLKAQANDPFSKGSEDEIEKIGRKLFEKDDHYEKMVKPLRQNYLNKYGLDNETNSEDSDDSSSSFNTAGFVDLSSISLEKAWRAIRESGEGWRKETETNSS
jgi:hypothetical protein